MIKLKFTGGIIWQQEDVQRHIIQTSITGMDVQLQRALKLYSLFDTLCEKRYNKINSIYQRAV